MKKQMHSMDVMMIAMVAIVAIVGISALLLAWRWTGMTPGFGNAQAWAGGPHVETQNPGQVDAGGGNLKSFGQRCRSDAECESGNCGGDIYDNKGQLVENWKVCI